MAALLVTIALLGLAAAGMAYTVLAAAALGRLLAGAERAYRAARAAREGAPSRGSLPPVSLLVPAAGEDPAFAASAAAYLGQRYDGPLEAIFCVLDPGDPAIEAAERAIAAAGPGAVAARVSVGDGRSSGPNRKVSNLAQGLAAARHEIVAMADADMVPAPDFVERLTAPLDDPAVGLSTSLYRSRGPRGLGGALEALAIDADFIPSVAAARALAPVRFALGAAIALRRGAIERIGGLEPLGCYIGEDYHLGRLVAERAGRIAFAAAALPTEIGRISLADHARHQLRWSRTVHVQRPLGHLGLIATNPFVPALALAIIDPAAWTLGFAAATFAIRAAAALAAARALGAPGAPARLLLLPFHDLLRFGIWLGGAIGRTVTWRGERFRIGRDGVIAQAR